MNLDKIIDKNLDEFFWDIYNSRVTFLRNNDEEYKQLQSKILETEEIDHLKEFFNDKKIKSLSEDDAEIILEYIQTLEERYVLDLKDLFYTTLAISKKINDKLDNILSDNS